VWGDGQCGITWLGTVPCAHRKVSGSLHKLCCYALCCRVTSTCGVPAGVALYNGVFKGVPLKRMLLGAMLLGVGLGATQVGPHQG